jgi:sporulation protein YlmC with PRC-barrel domain
MLKKLMITTALSGLLLSPALAQSPTPPAAQSMPQMSSSSGTADVIRSQSTNQLLASKFRGSAVLGADDQKIGGVTDVVFDASSGKVDAYVIGVGGFLGIGQKDVALAPSAFQLIKDPDTDSIKLKTSMTKDQLDKAATFEPRASVASTTGSGSRMSGSRSPAGGMGSRSPSSIDR